MSARQIDHLVKMANQIALNMAAWGDEDDVARMTGEHMKKFWTPAMLAQLLDYGRDGGDELSPVVSKVVVSMGEVLQSEGESS